MILSLLANLMIPAGWNAKNNEKLLTKEFKMKVVNDNREFNKRWEKEQILPAYWTEIRHLMKMKTINKIQHIENGNLKNTLKIIHWNLGSKKWNRKLTEIGNLLDEQKPDLCYVSEANLWEGLESYEREIPGHYLVLPNTMEFTKHARLVLIVKEGVEVVKLNQYMDRDISTIWVKIGKSGRKSLRIGGIYREHSVLGITNRNDSRQVLQEQMENSSRY